MMFPTDYAIDPAALAKEVEDRGFDSLWFPEHSHIPTSRESPYPGGGDLPRMYIHTYDPFVALTAAACATTTLKLATGICLVIERDTINTAKEVASLDHLSGRALPLRDRRRAGTARRWPTTAPTPRPACASWASRSRP